MNAMAEHGAAPERDPGNDSRPDLLWKVPLIVLLAAVLAASLLLFFSSLWYVRRYGDVGFESVAYAIRFHAAVAEAGQIRSFLQRAVLPAAAVFLVVSAALFPPLLRRRRSGAAVRAFAVLALSACLAVAGAHRFGIFEWLENRTESSTLYETEYVDPASVRIGFPERKRNLVCLYVESCETTFFSRDEGGALSDSAMPELFRLAGEGVNFSAGPGVGGWSRTEGAGWTAGAMVALTAGIPLTLPVRVNTYDAYESFLPGARALGDVLRDAGYRQALVIGSDKSFGGRDTFYLQHGTDEILDYGEALRRGDIPPGYKEWWGFEDRLLYPLAKHEIRRLADTGEPFAVTILTADTHPPDGYVCPLCPTNQPSRYANVFACASRQAGEFVDWLRSQDFWDDTTVLICGDHPCMTQHLFSEVLGGRPHVPRYVYNVLLNPARPFDPARTKNRVFTPMDMYPTVLSALGCRIEGDRLALGTDLFSDRPTLAERKGRKELNRELRLNSDFYFRRLVLGETEP